MVIVADITRKALCDALVTKRRAIPNVKKLVSPLGTKGHKLIECVT